MAVNHPNVHSYTGLFYPHTLAQLLFLVCFTLKIEALRPFETEITIYLLQQCKVSESSKPQQHRCETYESFRIV